LVLFSTIEFFQAAKFNASAAIIFNREGESEPLLMGVEGEILKNCNLQYHVK